MDSKMPWPKANPDEESGGWIVAPDLLILIKRSIEESGELDFAPDMEEVEAVLLAIWRMGLVPNIKV